MDMSDLIRYAKGNVVDAALLVEKLKKIVTITTMETRNSVIEKEPTYKGFLINGTQFKAPILKGSGTIKTVSGEVFMTGNVSLHGNVQDLGRTRGATMPPHAPLRRWVQLQVSRGKWELDPRRNQRAALNQAAFLVRRKIAKDPAKGIQFFERSIPEAQQKLAKRVDQATQELIRTFGGR